MSTQCHFFWSPFFASNSSDCVFGFRLKKNVIPVQCFLCSAFFHSNTMSGIYKLAVAALAATAVYADPQLGNIEITASQGSEITTVASPDYPWLYEFPMPLPPAAVPLMHVQYRPLIMSLAHIYCQLETSLWSACSILFIYHRKVFSQHLPQPGQRHIDRIQWYISWSYDHDSKEHADNLSLSQQWRSIRRCAFAWFLEYVTSIVVPV